MRNALRYKRIWIAVLLIAALLSGCGQAHPAPSPSPAPTPAPSPAATAPAPSPSPTPAAPPTSGTDIPAARPPASGTDIPAPTPTPEPTPSPAPTDPPAPTRLDDSFFDDAAFLGNSLMDGLRLFGGLKYGDFYSGTSASVVSAGVVKNFENSAGEKCTMLEALLAKQYKKIFVMFGINELGFQVDGFIDIYSELLAEIAAGEPDADIYVFSLTPITEKRSEESDLFTKERILEFNEAVEAMTERSGCHYMDLYSAFADADGWLPEEDASDGIHFTGAKYADWADFLRTYSYHFDDIA